LLDCCHAGGLTDLKSPGLQLAKSPLPPEAQDLFAQGQGRAAIASSQSDESSFAGKPYSAFTLALIEALCGAGVSRKDDFVRLVDLALHTREKVPGRTKGRQHPIMDFEHSDNFVLAYYAAGETETKGLPFTQEPEIEPEAGAWSRTFDQRERIVNGPQTNITGGVSGPVFSGQFSGPVSLRGEAIDLRGSVGAVYKPSGQVSQHFKNRIEIHGDGTLFGSGSAASLKAKDMQRFLADLQSLRQALLEAGLDDETFQAVDADLQTVQTQAVKQRPNKTIIISKLRSAAEIMAAADGSVGIVERMQALASSLLSLAGRLFG